MIFKIPKTLQNKEIPMKKRFFTTLPNKNKVPLFFTISCLKLILWSSLILLLSITTSTLCGKDKYIFFFSLYPAIEYILFSLVLVTGGGFFLDYIFCNSKEL